MGISSWLFSKNTESKSYIRRWLRQEMDKDDSDKTEVFVLFVALIYSASRFGKDGSQEQTNRFQEVARQYFGDATIFEVACYTYYRVEDWLLNNKRELRLKVGDAIAFWIIEIFSVAWQKDEKLVGQLFEEHLERYRSLASAGKDIEEIHLELEHRILNTKGDRFGKGNVRTDSPGTESDQQFVKQSLDHYVGTDIPDLLKAIQDYCRDQVKQEIETKIPLGLEEQADQEKRDYLYAMVLLEQRDFVKAAKAFTKVVDSNPEHYDALLQRGQLYVMLGQPMDAIDDFSKAIAVKPNDFRAFLQRGRCYHRALRLGDESLADYSKAISLAPEHAFGYFERGSLFDAIAQSIEKQALEKNDQEKVNQVSKEFMAAIKDYSQAITLNPEYDDAYVSRGLAYARKARDGNADFIVKAIADLEKAMSLNWEHGYLFKSVDELKALLDKNKQQLTHA